MAFPLNPEKLAYAKEVEQEATKTKDTKLLAEAFYLYGKLYGFAGDHATSKRYYLKSLNILEPFGDSFELGRIYVRLSENYKFVNTPQETKFINLARSVFERIKSKKGMVMVYTGLGQMHLGRAGSTKNKMEIDSALFCFKKLETLAYELKDTLVLAEAYLHLGELYQPENLKKAIDYFEKALPLYTIKHSARSQLTAMITLGTAYVIAGEFQRGYAQLVDARQFYADQKFNDHPMSSGLDKAFINYYETTGQWKEALAQFRKMYYKETDQFRAERDGALLKLQVEYETDKKELQIDTQKKELQLNNSLLRTQRNFIIITVALLLLAIGLTILFFRLSRKNKRTSNQNEHLVREQNHRVKNNLQMISSLLSMQERLLPDSSAKKAVEESRLRVQSMAIIQRKLYDGNNLSQVHLSEFMPELVQGVLHAYGFDHLQPIFVIQDINLDPDRTISLGLILTELVTNACKYAFPDNASPALRVNCEQEQGEISLTFSDNGPGIKLLDPISPAKNTTAESGSFGMQLIGLQVRQLSGDFSFKNQNGTTFEMTFDV